MGEKRLSDAELYIMQRFWDNGPMKTDELGALVADKGWKPTTLLTFLSRLEAKGMLRVQKAGKANLYTPLCSREAYQGGEGRAFLDELYGGSIRALVASLVDGSKITEGEIADLRAWLAAQEVKDDG